MNLTSYNSTSGGATGPSALPNAGSAEDTLRLIAQLSAPKGLEDRVLAGLESAPRRGRLLQWPSMLHSGSGWMRGAAAAAIVFVVAGGGWGIYTRVQPPQTTKVIVMPRAGAGGGFSNAGAMRTPQTLDGPVLAEPLTVQNGSAKPGDAQLEQRKPLKKAPAKVVPVAKGRPKAGVLTKQDAKPAVSAVQ